MSLEKFLNTRIADFAVLYAKLHRFHWYFEGSGFFPYHAKFEEMYDEASELLDEYAERLLAIGGRPIATLKEFAEYSVLSDAGNEVKLADIGKTIIADYTLLAEETKKGIPMAQEQNDETTADMFIESVGTFEKHVWMFKQAIAGDN